MKYIISVFFFLVGIGMIYTPQIASAYTVTGGVPNSAINAKSGSVALSDLIITCNAALEVSSATGLLISLQYYPPNVNDDTTPPVQFDITSSVVATYYATPTLTIPYTPSSVTADSINFTSIAGCRGNDFFKISGLKVAPKTGVQKEGTVKVKAQALATDYSANSFVVDTKPPTLIAATWISDANYTYHTIKLQTSETTINYPSTSFSPSHWKVEPVTGNETHMGTLTLTYGKAPFAGNVYLLGTPQNTTATYGKWNISTLADSPVKDAAGNSLSTNSVLLIDTIAPHITTVNPAKNSVVSLNTPVVISFSEPMLTSSVTVSISPSMQYTTQWSANNEVLTMTPTNESYNTTYTLTVAGQSAIGVQNLIKKITSHALSWSYKTLEAANDPVGTISLSGGQSETGTVLVTATVTFTNADLVQYGFKSDGSDLLSFESISSLKSFILPPAIGATQVCARFKNSNNGKISSLVCDSISVTLKASGAPTGAAMLINNGATTSNNQTVTLQFGAQNASHMAVSNYNSFSDTYWETYSPTKLWIVSAHTGTKYVYAIFRSSTGQISDVVSASIYYAPSGATLPSGSVSIADNASTTKTIYVNVAFNATDAQQMQWSHLQDLSSMSSYSPYTTLKSWTLKPRAGSQYICARFRNTQYDTESSVVCDSIELVSGGTGAPHNVLLEINNGAQKVASPQISLQLSANGAQKMALSANANFTDAEWEPYATLKSFTIPSGIGSKTVYAMFAAENGTVSSVISASVYLDLSEMPAVFAPKGPQDIRPLPLGITPHKLVKTKKSKTVYYIGTNGYRYYFPHAEVFYSWYDAKDINIVENGGRVSVISEDTLAQIKHGGNVTFRPGVRLLKIPTDSATYVVDKGNVLRWVMSEQIASALYGSTWAKNVRDIELLTFENYGTGANISKASDYTMDIALASATNISHTKKLPVP